MAEVTSNSNSNLSPPPNNKIMDKDRPKLKVLAFHGYRQNGALFRGKIGSFRKAVAKYAQLIFITAPHRVFNEDGGGDEDSRSWWFNAEDNTFSGKCLGGPAIGFESTLKLVEKTVSEHGPFHGFMGFSQGACLVGLLAAMQQKGYLPYTFQFAIFASGFCSGSLVHKGFYDEEISLPSLHVYGESDSIIPKEMSESLINLFLKPVVAEHSGGHYVACSGSIKDAYLDFLHDRYQDIYEENKEKDGMNS
ncbi:esterase AGAP003155 [Plodia interpunctella]|uniref:Carboxylesterase n=1 Tax=Plodia interpunctella TaxID=58824 RepID=A0A5B8R9N4_PLOIN|nr:esterase AGAP003155 [Plodia interpunctella]QEA03478.1 carboxylesterase [Plodia interpunctella]